MVNSKCYENRHRTLKIVKLCMTLVYILLSKTILKLLLFTLILCQINTAHNPTTFNLIKLKGMNVSKLN